MGLTATAQSLPVARSCHHAERRHLLAWPVEHSATIVVCDHTNLMHTNPNSINRMNVPAPSAAVATAVTVMRCLSAHAAAASRRTAWPKRRSDVCAQSDRASSRSSAHSSSGGRHYSLFRSSWRQVGSLLTPVVVDGFPWIIILFLSLSLKQVCVKSALCSLLLWIIDFFSSSTSSSSLVINREFLCK